jgi:hypothetical protein
MCQDLVRTMSKLATRLVPLGLVFFAALIAGCDSSADPNGPEAKKQAEATRAIVNKTDEDNAERAKKKGGKNASAGRNIKGGINVNKAAE